jgi:integrase
MVSIGSGANRYRATFSSYSEAVLDEKKQELIRSGAQLPAEFLPQENRKPTLQDAFDITLREVWSQKKSNHGKRSAEFVLKLLGKDKLIEEVNTSLIRELVAELEEDFGNAGSTVNAKLSSLSMMLKTAADEGWLESLPRIKRRKPGDHRIRWLDGEEEMLVLNACTKFDFMDLRDFVICAIDTGFRRMELLKFKYKEYRNGMLHLHPDQTKTSKARAVPATARVHDILVSRSNSESVFAGLSEKQLYRQWDEVRAFLGKTNDPQFVIHMLRHTCASRLAMQDKSAQFIQAWMGHSTPITTARYMHLAPGKLKEGVEALEQYRTSNAPVLRTA